MPFPLIPFIASLIPSVISTIGQSSSNRSIAAYQADRNEQYMREQNEYNTPANQMKRFQEAGLNPNLVYGQGSPGNQQSPLQYPNIQPTDFGRLMQMVPMMNQTRMTNAQVQATNAKTLQTSAMTELNKVQTAVLKKNPLLDEGALKAIIDSLKSAASIKASEAGMKEVEADWFTKDNQWTNSMGVDVQGPMGAYKLQREVQLLDQRFKLSELDAKIKAEVVNSKEFQNAILEVQKRFMVDKEITPQHYLQFALLLLQRL